MSEASHGPRLLATLLAIALLGGYMTTGCTAREADGPDPAEEAAEPPPADGPVERPEGFGSWAIVINDDDSYTEGGVTYSIALNLTATNPTQSIDGAYSGTAMAKTDTTGEVGGLPLNASAIANSTSLEFTLVDASGTAGDALAPLTAEEAVYTGTGTIVMAASGSGTIGPAGGGFSNTSGQPIEVLVQGSSVTLTVPISGHTYTFRGTLVGR